MEKRPSWDEYFLNIAREVAKRATCIRKKYGAIIVNPNESSIISTGYCGNAAGTINCCDIGKCFRAEAKIPSGMLYNLCQSIHAEENAIIFAGKKNCKGNLIYVSGISASTGELVSGKPCYKCESKIINVGLKKIVYWDKNQNIQRISVEDIILYRREQPFAESERELKLLQEKGFKL